MKWLRDQKSLRRIPVVVLASARQPIGFDQASELGAVSYLVKPVEKEALDSVVQAVLTYWKLS
jgi:CheY-like chemotaxis protein